MLALALPEQAEHWPVTTLSEKLVKIDTNIACHGRYAVVQTAKAAARRGLFDAILQRIKRLRRQRPLAA